MALINRKRKSSGGRVGSWKKSKSSSRAMYKKRKLRMKRSKFASAVMSVVNRRAETKEVFMEVAQNWPLIHNNLQNIYINAFYSDIGLRGEQWNGPSTATGTRVGKTIFVKGIKVALMIEALQKRAQTNFWLYLVRNNKAPTTAISAKGDMFEGRSSTIPMDYIDTDKVKVLFCKKMVLRMPNAATSASMDASGFAPTWDNAGNPQQKFVVTNPQKIQKFYIPINKKIEYQDPDDGASSYPQAWAHYQWVICSYDNYASPSSGTDSTIANLHMTTVMYFTDV